MGQHASLGRRAARMAALAAILVLPLASTPASGAFDPPTTISRIEPEAFTPQLAMQPDGDALVVWQGNDGTKRRVRARQRSAAGQLGGIQTLSDAGQDADSPQVAIDADGDALIVWRRFDGSHTRVQARTRSAAGQLGPVQTLSDPGQSANGPQVAMDADGEALVVWSRSDGTNTRIEGCARSAAGAFGAVKLLSQAGQNAGIAEVAMSPDGRALVVWQRFDGTRNRAEARPRSAAGRFGKVQTISGSGVTVFFGAQVAMDPEGDALLAWEVYDGTTFRVQARTRSAAGTLGPVRTLSAAERQASHARVAMNADGDGLVVWQIVNGGAPFANWHVQASAVSAAGQFGPAKDLSPTGQKVDKPQVGLNSDGGAVVAWYRLDTPRYQVEARTRSAAGNLGKIRILSEPDLYSTNPQVALDADGDALAVWSAGFGPEQRIQAAAGP